MHKKLSTTGVWSSDKNPLKIDVLTLQIDKIDRPRIGCIIQVTAKFLFLTEYLVANEKVVRSGIACSAKHKKNQGDLPLPAAPTDLCMGFHFKYTSIKIWENYKMAHKNPFILKPLV